MSGHEGAGVRVLEIGSGVAAAYCGKLLRRWGAHVTRVELPGERIPGVEGLAHHALDRYLNDGKRCLRLDYREEAGRAELDRLVSTHDCVISDLSARQLDEYRLHELGGERPPSIRVAITPFGLDGPYRDLEATPETLLALGGYSYLIGDPGRPPLTLPGHYGQYQAAHFAYSAVLATWWGQRRDADRTPRTIEVSVFESLAALHQFTTIYYAYSGWVRRRSGNRWRNLYPNTMLPCRDGWVGIIVPAPSWQSFCLMIGRPEWAEDRRFATPADRLAHADELDAAIVEAFANRTMQDLFVEGQEVWRLPITRHTAPGDVLGDPHLDARRFWEASSPGLRSPGSPFRFLAKASVRARPLAPAARRGGRPSGAGHMPPAGPAPAAADPARNGLPDPLPLSGVRVLDLTRIYAGPLATRILADLGAEIVKVEAIDGRGPARVARTPSAVNYADGDPGEEPWNRQAAFNELARNKKSIAVDLKRPEGKELFRQLVSRTDIVIENFSARAMARLGLGYDELRLLNDQLIYVAMPGFGLSGPYRDYVILGPALEPMTGRASMLGYGPDEPRVSTLALPDAIGGTTAATAVLTALVQRESTGEGMLVDFSLHEAAIATMGERLIEYQLTGDAGAPAGNAHAVFAPSGVYPCDGEDQWIAITTRDERDWRELCALAGLGWEHGARFGEQSERRLHREALDEIIGAWTSGQSKFELMERLQSRSVPAAALLDAAELIGDAHLAARHFYLDLDHPVVGPRSYQGSPFRIDGRRAAGRRAPLLGEHNAMVLQEWLGMTADEVSKLEAAGVLGDRPRADA